MASKSQPLSLDAFLLPLQIDIPTIHGLARSLCSTFNTLAAQSKDQFLPTPISEELLRPRRDEDGRYLAIDIGGTNLRVGFIELFASGTFAHGDSRDEGPSEVSRVQRHLEKSWPIGEQLKNDKAGDLFAWMGERMVEVVQDACRIWPGELSDELPLGVSFSFPMIQHSLSDATLMSMGKGFQITSNLDLARLLLEGYESSRGATLPRVQIAAIVNDSVATLVSFAYMFRKSARRKAAMGLIVGTGCNATIPLAPSQLHPSKRPEHSLGVSEKGREVKITVNTEFTINGSARALLECGLVTPWDEKLDAEGESPGFQPFEYMTSGRYLGELGRIIIVDFLTHHLLIAEPKLPPLLTRRHGLTTTFLGNLGPPLCAEAPSMLRQLEQEIPAGEAADAWQWTADSAHAVYTIAKAIQVRAAGMVAAAVVALLACAGEIPLSPSSTASPDGLGNGNGNGTAPEVDELMVGYTGGCIVHFQDYLHDCQRFLDEIMSAEFGRGDDERAAPRVVLRPCHDGGIIGAGILAATAQGIANETAVQDTVPT